jgi:hypothetical protein
VGLTFRKVKSILIQQDSETTLKGKAEVEQPVYEFEVWHLDLAGQQLCDLGGTLIEPFDGEFALLHSFRSNPAEIAHLPPWRNRSPTMEGGIGGDMKKLEIIAYVLAIALAAVAVLALRATSETCVEAVRC